MTQTRKNTFLKIPLFFFKKKSRQQRLHESENQSATAVVTMPTTTTSTFSQLLCQDTTPQPPSGITSNTAKTTSLQQQQLHYRNKPTTGTPPTALIILEIVERILSFLPVWDRQVYACLVCKEWNTICKDLTPTTYTWLLRLAPTEADSNSNGKDEDLAIKTQVSQAHHIIIRPDYINKESYTQKRLAPWATMMSTLSDILRDHKRRPTLSRLWSLHLKEGVLESFTTQLPQLPRLHSLTTLRIDVAATWCIMHLFTIFKACPNLEELEVSDVNPVPGERFLRNEQHSPVITFDQENAFINGSHGLPIMTHLHTCSVDNMIISLPTLEFILNACPRLSKLILAQCIQHSRYVQGQAHYNKLPSMVDRIATHCPNLKSFHISMSQDRDVTTKRELASVFKALPHMDELHLMDRDMWRPYLINELRTVANRITTLNLISYKRRFDKPKSTWLREVLCSFKHLIHLRARSAIYRFEDMDLNDMRWQQHERQVRTQGVPSRRDYPRIPSGAISIASQYIWACRGLRTLHISVIYHGSDMASLTIFGFLSRMCPQLQELHLALGMVPLSLQGGFCLLTRLERLERLRITTSHYDCTDDALFWLQPTVPSKTQDCIDYPHRQRQTLEAMRKCPDYLTPPDVVAAGSKLVEKGREMGMDLSKIGHADDLLEWFDDRYGLSTNAFLEKDLLHVWPKLQLLWFEFSAYGEGSNRPLQKTKKVMAKARPNVDFRLTWYHPDDYKLRIFKY